MCDSVSEKTLYVWIFVIRYESCQHIVAKCIGPPVHPYSILSVEPGADLWCQARFAARRNCYGWNQSQVILKKPLLITNRNNATSINIFHFGVWFCQWKQTCGLCHWSWVVFRCFFQIHVYLRSLCHYSFTTALASESWVRTLGLWWESNLFRHVLL